MLWSQIKLTSYDFSDLHITGEFDNRPGTRQFLRIFSCVVTYRTGAGRHMYRYMITVVDVVWCPAGIVRDQTMYRARPILHEFSRTLMDTFI